MQHCCWMQLWISVNGNYLKILYDFSEQSVSLWFYIKMSVIAPHRSLLCNVIFVITDPNDVESPRASFILPSKYGVNPQTPPVSPNEEDLSLVLGTMQVCANRCKLSVESL